MSGARFRQPQRRRRALPLIGGLVLVATGLLAVGSGQASPTGVEAKGKKVIDASASDVSRPLSVLKSASRTRDLS